MMPYRYLHIKGITKADHREKSARNVGYEKWNGDRAGSYKRPSSRYFSFFSLLALWGLFMGAIPNLLPAQERIACDSSFFISLQGNASSRIVRGVFTPNGPKFREEIGYYEGRQFGPIGYSVWDGHLYALDLISLTLHRIDANGNLQQAADLRDQLPEDLIFTAGYMNPSGIQFSFIGHRPNEQRDITTYSIRVDAAGSRPGSNATINPTPVFVTAAARSPALGILYGFEENRPSVVQIGGGLVSSYNYPSLGNTSIGAYFFDENNNLWGYGSASGFSGTQFFGIDIGDGSTFPLEPGNYSGIVDGCSCPYRIKLYKQFSADTLTYCDTLELTYTFENTAGFTYQDLSFRDTLPQGLSVLEVLNDPPGSTLTLGPDGLISLDFTYLTLGENDLTLRVGIEPDFQGSWNSQATLDTLPWGLGTVIRSQNKTPDAEVSGFSVVPLALEMTGDSLLCVGSTGTLRVDLIPSGADAQIRWSNGATSASIEVSEPGWYGVTASQECDTLRDSIYIGQVPYELTVSLGRDRLIQQGQTVQLNFETNALALNQIQWTSLPETGLSCLDCENPSLFPLSQTSISVNIEDEYGCTASDQLIIQVDTTRGLRFPNVFTPNGDQLNDRFYFQAEGLGQIRVLQVFDRWGRLVFEGKDLPFNQPDEGWDGIYRGKPADEGTYFWRAELEFPDGSTLQRSGMLTLIR